MLLTGLRDILFQFMGGDIETEENDKKNKNTMKNYWIEFKKMIVGNKKRI